MVSDRHQCIFIHLRRTGGNSIEQALGGIVLLDKEGNVTKKWDNNLHRGHDVPHKKDFRGHYLHDTAMAVEQKNPSKFKQYSKFSIIRNPWDQMISLYLRLNSSDTNAVNFLPWLKSYNILAGTIPQHSLFNADNMCLMDEIGRFENLHQDFINICSRLNIKTDALEKTNASSKKYYAEYYDTETIELVSRLFKKDIQYFGYQFDK